MVFIIPVITFFLIFIITLIGFNTLSRSKRDIAEDVLLRQLKQQAVMQQRNEQFSTGVYDDVLKEKFFDRVIKPMLGKFGTTALKYTPREMLGQIEKKLEAAGKPWETNEFLAICGVIDFFAICAVIFLGVLAKLQISFIFLFIVVALIFSVLLPHLILNSKIRERIKQMRRSLPDVLDLLTVCVEAGLGFDGALQKVSEKTKGPLAYEFQKTLNEIRMGRTRRDALRDLGKRNDLQELTNFTAAIIQADRLGTPIAVVLKIQSDQMRVKRRQTAQEAAMKAPVKLLFPLIIFIFPTLFVVLLGPALIQVLRGTGVIK